MNVKLTQVDSVTTINIYTINLCEFHIHVCFEVYIYSRDTINLCEFHIHVCFEVYIHSPDTINLCEFHIRVCFEVYIYSPNTHECETHTS